MKKRLALIFTTVALCAAYMTGCGGLSYDRENATEATTESTQESTLSAEQQEMIDNIMKPVETLPQLEGVQVGDTIATIHTNYGDIKVWFFPEYAPKAVENFITHAQDGYYDGVIFHRVINNFMIQGGDPEGTGAGGESIWGEPFETEVSFDLKHFRGALCMAKTSDPISIGSQFYIVQNPSLSDSEKSSLEQLRSQQDEIYYQDDNVTMTIGDVYPEAAIDEYINNGGYPSLDMQYTVFGQVYEGMDVVDAIAAVQTDSNDKPLEDVVIESIDVGTYEG